MVKYISPIDPHVHLRWNEYAAANFARLAFRDAKSVGICAMIEQPNTVPALTDLKSIEERINYIDKIRYDGNFQNIRHFIHVALTPLANQREEAMDLVQNHERVTSTKTFYVTSTKSGDIEIKDQHEQKKAWSQKAERGYLGPDIGHFEAQDAFGPTQFDPKNPKSHSLFQNAEAELVQVERQFKFAYDAKYKGDLVILHTSNPDSIDFIEKMRATLRPEFRVFFETTFHHMFLNFEDYDDLGNLVKMNPPLRSKEMQERLLEYVISERTDIIGTDHAPHTLERKTSDKPASGVPAIAFWPKGIELLQKNGIRQKHLENLIFGNSNRIYNLGLKPGIVDFNYDPDLWNEYGFNPFSRIDK